MVPRNSIRDWVLRRSVDDSGTTAADGDTGIDGTVTTIVDRIATGTDGARTDCRRAPKTTKNSLPLRTFDRIKQDQRRQHTPHLSNYHLRRHLTCYAKPGTTARCHLERDTPQ